MSSKTVQILIVLAVAGLAFYLFEGGAKKKKPKRGGGFAAFQRIMNGERWQPSGVQGPSVQGEAVFAPPLAAINP